MNIFNHTVYSATGDTETEAGINLDLLSVFSRDYMFLYYYDLQNNIKALRVMDYDALGVSREAFEGAEDPFEMVQKEIETHIHPEDIGGLKEALDPANFSEVLKHTNQEIINARWKYKEFGYLYNQIIISGIGESGEEPKAVVIGLREVGRETREKIIRENINRRYASTIFALSQEYPEVFIIDIEKNEMSPCYPSLTGGHPEDSIHSLDYDAAISGYIRDTVIADQQEHMLLVLSREYIKWSLRKGDTYTREYLDRDNRYCEIKFIKPEAGDDISIVIMGYGVKDEEIRSKIEDARERDFQQSLMDGLSREYHTVWLIHPDRTMELYRTTGISTIMEALRIGMEVKDYSLCMPLYVKRYVSPQDQDRLLEEGTYYNLIKNIPENGIMPVTYRRIDSGGNETYHQVCFAKAQGIDDEINIVMAFRDVDATIRQQIQERERYNSAVRERDSDGLTGMNNRFCYERRIKEYPDYNRDTISCIYVDVDGLHELNNTKGHEAGDIMLKFIADNIQNMWGVTDTYRIGGDEFVGFLFDKKEEDLIEEMRIYRKLVTDEGYRVSMGQATGKLAGISMPDFIKIAEERMYAEKRSHYQGANDRRAR